MKERGGRSLVRFRLKYLIRWQHRPTDERTEFDSSHVTAPHVVVTHRGGERGGKVNAPLLLDGSPLLPCHQIENAVVAGGRSDQGSLASFFVTFVYVAHYVSVVCVYESVGKNCESTHDCVSFAIYLW